jgi:polyisoprenoid-binding protein YceI
MTKSFRSSCIYVLSLALTIFVLAMPLVAAGDTVPPGKLALLELDPAKTIITYSLDGWPHHTQGTFKLKRGVIEIDPSTGKMTGTITVDAASGDSGHSIRDEEMKSSVLEVDRFPEISFTPRQVLSHGEIQSEFQVKVDGLMLLHGGQHDLTVDAVVKRAADSVTIHSSFAIPFVEWGLKDPSILMFKVSKEVSISVTAVGRLSWNTSTATPKAAYSIHKDGQFLMSETAQPYQKDVVA